MTTQATWSPTLQRPGAYMSLPGSDMVTRNSSMSPTSTKEPEVMFSEEDGAGGSSRSSCRCRSMERKPSDHCLYAARWGWRPEYGVHLIPVVLIISAIIIAVPTIYKAYAEPNGGIPEGAILLRRPQAKLEEMKNVVKEELPASARQDAESLRPRVEGISTERKEAALALPLLALESESTNNSHRRPDPCVSPVEGDPNGYTLADAASVGQSVPTSKGSVNPSKSEGDTNGKNQTAITRKVAAGGRWRPQDDETKR